MLKPLILRFLKSVVRGGMWGGGAVGLFSDSQLDAIAGGLAIIVSILWSVWEERSKTQVPPSKLSDVVTETHQTLTVLALATFIAVGCGGCKSVTPEQAAYRTLGTVATSVDSGMKAWGEWVALGKATAADVEKSKELYLKYQSAMRVARDAALTVKQNPQAGTWNIALTTVEAAAGDLLNFISTLTR